MKISISYLPDDAGEAKQVKIIRSFLESFLPGAKVRFSHRHDLYLHIYLATKKPGKPCDSKKTLEK